MGFWSVFGEFVEAFAEGYAQGHPLYNAHPSLKEAWARYEAQGYSLHQGSPLALTGVKVGAFKDVTVQIRVLENGSVEVVEGGFLGESYTIPRRPGAPTAAQHLASVGSTDSVGSGKSGSFRPSVLETKYVESGDGLIFTIVLDNVPSAPSEWALLLLHPGRGDFIKGVEPFTDDDGDFIAGLRHFPGQAALHGFIPRGAVRPTRHLPVEGRLIGSVSGQGIEPVDFTFPDWNADGNLSFVTAIRPLIESGRWISEASGRDPEATIRAMAAELEADGAGLRLIRSIWRDADRLEIPSLGSSIAIRMPGWGHEDMVSSLVDALTTGGSPSDDALAIARVVAFDFGVDEAMWQAATADLGAKSTGIDRAAALGILELPVGASDRDVREAYRRLMRDYHPDRVANLPKGFQEYAKERAQEINAAYALLMPKAG